MSYATLEVELRGGRVIPRQGEVLPESARALLVLLQAEDASRADTAGHFVQILDDIRARQTARGHSPRSDNAVRRQVLLERESWE